MARLAATGARTAASQSTSAYLPRSGTAGGCSGARHTGSFTPNQYLTAYGYRGLHNQGLEGQGERAALIEIDGYRASDINGFVRCFRLPYPHISVHPVGGLRHPLAPGGETTLDLELMTAAAPRLSNIYVYESRGTAGHVLRAYSAALARGRRPQVISASLGICEPLALDTMGKPGINGIERILATAAGVRGQCAGLGRRSGLLFVCPARAHPASPRGQLPGLFALGDRGGGDQRAPGPRQPHHGPGGLE